MTEDDRLESLVRSALPAVRPRSHSRDLLPLVVDRISTPVRWSWLDIGLAAGVTGALLMFPQWFLLLAFHL